MERKRAPDRCQNVPARRDRAEFDVAITAAYARTANRVGAIYHDHASDIRAATG